MSLVKSLPLVCVFRRQPRIFPKILKSSINQAFLDGFTSHSCFKSPYCITHHPGHFIIKNISGNCRHTVTILLVSTLLSVTTFLSSALINFPVVIFHHSL
ncbi:Uncharacterized protein TCM_038857 [Theobroma cacao]|uniref:Uncharacterized protein n=1 Tax=Theobroma cacao TaxID=3641 RepID=A0A061GPJ3_THECC|nr:Uncharacterized protein TCM_038857 [Theobroma cacao]